MQFELDIEANDIFKAIKDYEKLPQKLENAKIKILNRLADEAINVIQENCPEKTKELVSSIQKSEVFIDTITVFTDNAYARYVEFGTGMVGQNSPHPTAADFGWVYDINSHGEAGWKYQDKFGEWHWTQGQTGSQFMYKAYQYLEQNYLRIAQEVLKEEGFI